MAQQLEPFSGDEGVVIKACRLPQRAMFVIDRTICLASADEGASGSASGTIPQRL
jgi:hypothetical protein